VHFPSSPDLIQLGKEILDHPFVSSLMTLFCSASLHMESEETNTPCKSVSHKVLDDSLVPLSKDAAEDASTQLISSQENRCDDVNFLICPPEMLSCNSAMV